MSRTHRPASVTDGGQIEQGSVAALQGPSGSPHWLASRRRRVLLQKLIIYPILLAGACVMIIPFVRFAWNTVFVTALALLGQLISSSLVAFGFARLRFPGRDVLFLILLATIMIPYQVTLIPTFILFRILGWLDTYAPLIVPYWLGGGAFFIFLLRQFYMRLPLDLDDAGRIDGASTFGIYRHIILPQSRPALGVVAVFSFLNHWNDFFNPLIFLSTTEKYTLALGINLFRGYQVTQWHLLMAASVMVSFPCILLYALAQRYFIQGIVFTGVKQ